MKIGPRLKATRKFIGTAHWCLLLSVAVLATSCATRRLDVAAPSYSENSAICTTNECSNGELLRGGFGFLEAAARAIESNRDEVRRILHRVDSTKGADYEIQQAIKTLRGAEAAEGKDLLGSRNIGRLAVYGSTNIPLYTLVLHVLVPSVRAENISFRTATVTRATYRDLWLLLKSELEKEFPGFATGIDVITEGGDLDFDVFRQVHLAGLGGNKKATFRRDPAEMVIFTGNMEKGRLLIEKYKSTLKTRAERGRFNTYMNQTLGGKRKPNLETVFIMFGAGHNPMFLTSTSSREELQTAVEATVEPVLINGSQDCIVPNFLVVHEAVVEDFVKNLKESLGKLRFGQKTAEDTDYSELTFEGKWLQLPAFISANKEFLRHGSDAIVNVISRRVDPMVFVFPMRKFLDGSVPLQEWFAPVTTVFTYSNAQEALSLIRDPRVLKKSMLASVFGNKESPEFIAIDDELAKTQHTVFHNESVFAAEDGNKPFGGSSRDAAAIFNIKVNPYVLSHPDSSDLTAPVAIPAQIKESLFKMSEVNKPVLFSKQLREYFPR
jgi:aldehyde dehydrogenase (NAD+)